MHLSAGFEIENGVDSCLGGAAPKGDGFPNNLGPLLSIEHFVGGGAIGFIGMFICAMHMRGFYGFSLNER
jgi:hypothetical protein